MDSHCFMVEKPCPVCMKNTRVLKTRSRLMVEKTDEDFCVHYKGFNPYYYKIWVCEHCGYAADEKTFLTKMPERQRKMLWDFLAHKQLEFEFKEERDIPDAIASYQLALSYLDIVESVPSKKASLNLQLGWIYRFMGESEKEAEYLLKAAEFYDESITKERYPIGNLTDSGAMYLVGAIYYRLGDMEKCAQHLSRIIGDQSVRSREPKIYDKARDLWSDVRAQQNEEKKKAGSGK
ncbi:MAG: DUF2225 domain-containing protein [Selenomonadaceae bacterium]|nr:DUF2225 domain-containing protein [Selenomonadaceae bacterium]